MQIAVLTDIHSNLPALEAVLEATEQAGLKQRWCLGDVVGYGAQPDECAALTAEHCELSLVGNHDLAVTGEIDTEVFSASAAAAGEWTRANSDAKTLDFLKGLKPEATDREVGLYHASPRDPVWEYVLSVDQARECMEEQAGRVSLIGHSHVALYFSERPAKADSAARLRMATRSTWPRAAGCSIRAASVSPATATRGPPGCTSTPTSMEGHLSAGSEYDIGSRGRRDRREAGLPGPAPPTGSRWASDCGSRRPERAQDDP